MSSFTTNSVPVENPDTYWHGCGWEVNCSDHNWEGRSRGGCGWNGGKAGYNDDRHCLRKNPGWESRYCPAWGPVTAAQLTGEQTISCTYSSINADKVFLTEVSSKFPSDTVNGQQGYRATFCKAITNPSDLIQQKSNCLPYFGGSAGLAGVGGNETVFNGQVLDLCARLPNNGWQSNGDCVDAVRRTVNSNENGNTQKAYDMMAKWCRGGDGHADKKGMGPGRTANDPRCACFNVRDFGFKDEDSCVADNRKDLEGCNRLHDRLKNFIESGGPGLQVIKAMNVDTGCLSQDCALAKEQGSADDIFPYESEGVSCGDVTLNICNIDIEQRVAMNSAVKAECNFPEDSGGAAGSGGGTGIGGSGAPSSSAPGMAPEDEPAGELPITWKPFAKIFDTETKQYAFMSSCCATCLLLVILLIFMMKGPSGPSSSNMLAAKLASI